MRTDAVNNVQEQRRMLSYVITVCGGKSGSNSCRDFLLLYSLKLLWAASLVELFFNMSLTIDPLSIINTTHCTYKPKQTF
jgi:V8-like Glu-specific endopeptidase